MQGKNDKLKTVTNKTDSTIQMIKVLVLVLGSDLQFWTEMVRWDCSRSQDTQQAATMSVRGWNASPLQDIQHVYTAVSRKVVQLKSIKERTRQYRKA